MKMHVAGVKVLTGTSKKNGQPFVMATVFGLVPVENFAKADLAARGFGFEPSEVALDPDAVEAFKDVKLPALLDLETDAVPRFGKYETVVIGIVKPAALKPAA